MVFITGGVFTPTARVFLRDTPNTVLEKPIQAAVVRDLLRERLAG
jgi:hypothetical protein